MPATCARLRRRDPCLLNHSRAHALKRNRRRLQKLPPMCCVDPLPQPGMVEAVVSHQREARLNAQPGLGLAGGRRTRHQICRSSGVRETSYAPLKFARYGGHPIRVGPPVVAAELPARAQAVEDDSFLAHAVATASTPKPEAPTEGHLQNLPTAQIHAPNFLHLPMLAISRWAD